MLKAAWMRTEGRLVDDVRTRGVAPGRRRLALGLTSIIGREDGSVIEVFPDGTEKVLKGPSDQAPVKGTRTVDDAEK